LAHRLRGLSNGTIDKQSRVDCLLFYTGYSH
jgi:hypothetical protein